MIGPYACYLRLDRTVNEPKVTSHVKIALPIVDVSCITSDSVENRAEHIPPIPR